MTSVAYSEVGSSRAPADRVSMRDYFQSIELRVSPKRFTSWEDFMAGAPEYSIGLEVVDDTPGHRGHYVHFDHHAGVVREATMSAAMQAYIAVRQGKLMWRWLQKRSPVPVYVWNADQDVCLAAFILENHDLLERADGNPLLRWIVQYNNKIDVCGGLYPVNLDELVKNHFTWVFEPYHRQRLHGKTQSDEGLVKDTIRQVCERLQDLLDGRAGIAPITAEPEILYTSPYGFVIADEKGDPNSRLVLASHGHTNLISLVCRRPSGRYTYSIIRGSPYDEDIFQIPKLIDAFQAAEDQPEVRMWGGSTLAAGSDSELGSSLDWTRLRDIAEPLVRDAWLAQHERVPRPATQQGRALLVMHRNKRARLQHLLEECGVTVIVAECCAEARAAAASAPPLDAIFSPMTLPDGNFRTLLDLTSAPGAPIPFILCLPQIDGGWIDLLEQGAYDLLVEPYESGTVRSIISGVREISDAREACRLAAAAGGTQS